ncbi:MAG: hypothetical protein IKJ66_07225 [Bacteroidaceae bacterium]|nr:hypothetical protein [Bacteroidaceae bacterium]
MKKFLPIMAVAIAAVIFNACTNDVKEDEFVINNGEPEVTINRLGGSVEIPVTTQGEWEASIVKGKDSRSWCNLDKTNGTASDKIIVNVDYFSLKYQKQDRTVSIVVKSGQDTKTVVLRQYIGLTEGETVSNDESDNNYPDLWHGKGVGKGLEATTGNPSTEFVVNIKNVIEYSKQADYSTLFSQTKEPGMTVGAVWSDTLENNMDSLRVAMTINVKYAKFKLGIKGEYKNYGAIVEHASTYNGSQDLAFLTSSLSVSDLRHYLSEDWDEASNDWKADKEMISHKLISSGFLDCYRDLMQAQDDDEDFEGIVVDVLLDNFGAFIISGATLGGSIFTSIQYDSLAVSDDFHIDGQVTASYMQAAIDITGNVSAGYQKTGLDIWQCSNYYCEVSGGDQKAYEALLEQMEVNTPDRDKLTEAARDWMKSITCTDEKDNNAAIIKYRYTGIWNIFPSKVARKIKKIIEEEYKNQTLFVDIKSMGEMPVSKK